MRCVDATGSVLVDSMVVKYLFTCGRAPVSSWLGIVTLDSSLVFGTMVGSRLLDISVACECSSSGGVIISCLVACSGVPNSCFLSDIALVSDKIGVAMVSSCLLGANAACEGSPGV